MSLENDLLNSRKLDPYMRTITLRDIFKDKNVDTDRPMYATLVSMKTGSSLKEFSHVREYLKKDTYVVYVLDLISLKDLKKLIDNPDVLQLSDFSSRTYSEQLIRDNYPKQKPKNKGPKFG